ncbi:MAG TPA: twin-arginine translocase TatA/TatE family subunit [Candidatus Dormibacteraeota bacterium]|nr:twin-arginine translocase TatA/TatE family subunit [Candidatus Dormibacteraeota bacterium]
MFGLGHAWIILVLLLAIVLIVIGPGKLSQLGGALGQSLKEFRKSQSESPPAGEPPKPTE